MAKLAGNLYYSGARSGAVSICYVESVTWRERVSVDPKVLVGKPVITGTRVAVEQIMDHLAAGWSEEQILASYPRLTSDDVRACLAYASDILHSEKVYPLEPA